MVATPTITNMKDEMKCLAFLSMASLLLLQGCNGDWSFNEPYTVVRVSHKGCVMDHTAGGTTNSLVLDVQTTYLPDGRVQCVIQTVNPPKK